MKNNVKALLKELMTMDGNTTNFNQLMSIIDLPDDQFDEVYPILKESVGKSFNSPLTQNEIIGVARMAPPTPEEKEETKKFIEDYFNDIDNDETLSNNKKDLLKTIFNISIDVSYDIAENPRERVPVKIMRVNPDAKLPTYAHNSDAGADVYAVEDVSIPPHTTVLVSTGIKVAIPLGYEVQIRPRSGLSLKSTLRVANAPGTIDAEFRGEVKVIMENIGNLTAKIHKGDKIAQMLIAPTPMIVWEEVEELDETERNEKGFGSTDQKS